MSPVSDAIPASPSAGSRRLGVPALLGLLAVLLLLLGFAVALRNSKGALEPGSEAPDFELQTLEGEVLSLASLRGQVVVLNFWASWCLPCAAEAPELEAIWRDYRERGVTLVGIAYTDTRPAAAAYIDRFDISYPNGMDQADRISRRYRLAGVPETLVIDRQGRIVPLTLGEGPPVDRMVGPLGAAQALSPAALRALLDQLLAEQGA